MSRTKRKAYTGSKAVDKSCRGHGDCPYCKGNREHKDKQKELTDKEQVQDALSNM